MSDAIIVLVMAATVGYIAWLDYRANALPKRRIDGIEKMVEVR